MGVAFPVERIKINGCFELVDSEGRPRPDGDFMVAAPPHVFGVEGLGFHCRLEEGGETLMVLGPQEELAAHLERRFADPAAVMRKSAEIALRAKEVYFPATGEWGALRVSQAAAGARSDSSSF